MFVLLLNHATGIWCDHCHCNGFHFVDNLDTLSHAAVAHSPIGDDCLTDSLFQLNICLQVHFIYRVCEELELGREPGLA